MAWWDIRASGMGLTEEGERVRKALFEEGEALEGSRVAAELDMEFDELFVRGRRRKDGRKEPIGLKQGLGYEGRERDGQGRANAGAQRGAKGVSTIWGA